MTPHEPYVKIRDPQSERTGWEIKAIFAIVIVFICAGLVWRAVTHSHPGREQAGYGVVHMAPPTPPAPPSRP